jgi:hypothetical protein
MEEGKEHYGPASKDYFWLLCHLLDSLSEDFVKGMLCLVLFKSHLYNKMKTCRESEWGLCDRVGRPGGASFRGHCQTRLPRRQAPRGRGSRGPVESGLQHHQTRPTIQNQRAGSNLPAAGVRLPVQPAGPEQALSTQVQVNPSQKRSLRPARGNVPSST